MTHQWYWAHWWKLWMFHTASYDPDLDIFFNVRSFGPLQWSYYDNKGTFEERSYRRGRNHAEEQSKLLGRDVAFDLHYSHYTLDYGHPFDRGIIDYFSENMGS